MKDKKQRGEIEIKVLLEYANSIIATLREPFLVLDKNLQVISANHAFYATFEVTEKDTMGQLLPDLGDRQWNIPKLLQLLKEIIPEKKVVKDYEVEHKFEQIGQRTILLNASQLRVPKKIAGIIAAGAREEEEEELILLAIEDITERKRLQDELKESEERYRRAFETSRDGLLLVHKTEADILNSNASAQELLGYSQEEFLKKKLWEIGMVKDAKDFQETLSRLEKDGMVHYEDAPVKTKKGLSINSEVFLVNKAKVIQCNIRNITERKKNEDLVLGLNEQLQTILDASPAMIFYKDKENRFIRVNDAFAKANGISKQEMEGKTMWDIYSKEAAEHYWQDDKEVMATGKSKLNIIESMETPQGTMWVQTDKIPYRDLDGNIIGIIGFTLDITERREAETKIKESESLYRSLIETTNTGYVIIDAKGKVIDANSEYVRLTGYRELNEMRGRSVIEWTADYEKEKNSKAVEECSKNGYIRNLEIDYVDSHGKITPIEINATVVGLGGTPQILALCRDISERRQMEERLKASAREWEDTFNSISDLVSIQDKNFKYIKVNKAFADLFKVKPEEMIGKTCYEFIHQKNEPIPGCPHKLALDTKKPATTEVFEPRLGVYLEVNASPLIDEKGEVFATVHLVKNITERKQAEERLRLQAEIMRDLSEGIYLVRTSDGIIVYANPKFEEIFGYGSGELIGKHVSIVNAPAEKSPEETAKEITEFLKKNKAWTGEVKNIKKDGTPFWCFASVSSFQHPDFGEVWVSVHTDITERKRIEEELKKKMEELERFNKVAVGRELKMVELKNRIKELEEK